MFWMINLLICDCKVNDFVYEESNLIFGFVIYFIIVMFGLNVLLKMCWGIWSELVVVYCEIFK